MIFCRFTGLKADGIHITTSFAQVLISLSALLALQNLRLLHIILKTGFSAWTASKEMSPDCEVSCSLTNGISTHIWEIVRSEQFTEGLSKSSDIRRPIYLRSIDEFWGIYLVYYNWEILTEVSYKYSSFFVVWFFLMMFMIPIVGLHLFEYFLKTGFFFFFKNIMLKQLKAYSQIISVKNAKY